MILQETRRYQKQKFTAQIPPKSPHVQKIHNRNPPTVRSFQVTRHFFIPGKLGTIIQVAAQDDRHITHLAGVAQRRVRSRSSPPTAWGKVVYNRRTWFGRPQRLLSTWSFLDENTCFLCLLFLVPLKVAIMVAVGLRNTKPD